MQSYSKEGSILTLGEGGAVQYIQKPVCNVLLPNEKILILLNTYVLICIF